MNPAIRTSATILFSMFFAMLAGCQTRSAVVERAQVTAGQFRKTLAEVNPQIDRSVTTLTKLLRTDTTVHGATFAQYQKDLAKLEELVYPLRYQTDRLRREGIDYFKAWAEEMYQAETSADRKNLELVRANADAKYKRFMEQIDRASRDFRQLFHDLKDIEEYLGADLSNKNIAAQQPLIDAAITRSADVKAHVNLLEGEIKSWIK